MEYMQSCTRKITLWHTKTFNPLTSHDALEVIMVTHGFIAGTCTTEGGITWKEYSYSKVKKLCSEAPPRIRLPYPRFDGLHIYTYRAFLDAVNFYLGMTHISDLFHIRGMPLHRVDDRNRKWRRMEEDDSVFVYREGTLDQTIYDFYHSKRNDDINSNDNSVNGCTPVILREKAVSSPAGCIAKLE